MERLNTGEVKIMLGCDNKLFDAVRNRKPVKGSDGIPRGKGNTISTLAPVEGFSCAILDRLKRRHSRQDQL